MILVVIAVSIVAVQIAYNIGFIHGQCKEFERSLKELVDSYKTEEK